MEIILTPPIAFVLYVALVGVLFGFGRLLAGETKPSPLKSSTYASGEEAPAAPAVPGYRQFFAVALFFAVLHLGVLILATGAGNVVMLVALAGFMLALLALILG
ncbi:MAG: hypothetical protein RMN25_06185 [Anaerolineae bacterium]|nr:NADH-quinone oxidoreductase subunit A [Thermoflexales bacterium]MDW8407356.1 hypothetical protein [Anaerolineae bacterium]